MIAVVGLGELGARQGEIKRATIGLRQILPDAVAVGAGRVRALVFVEDAFEVSSLNCDAIAS